MTYLNIKTPTVLDLRELFTLGLTSKRDGNSIGHKGSGLKFSLAQLHRLGASLEVWTPQGHWRSEVKSDIVRGEVHDFIILRDGNGHEIPTHITAQAGADTWTEAWFCLRELLQNVIDEGGEYDVTSDPGLDLAGESYTIMQIVLTEPLAEAWAEHSRWFHPRHPEVLYDSPHKGFYYHGFLIYAQEEWRYAYDVTGIIDRSKLSEDRQLRSANFDTIFDGILAACELPDSFYEILIHSGHELPQDLGYLQSRIYQRISHSRPDFGGFKMARLIQKFRAQFGPKVCWSSNSDKGSQEWYYAKATGFDPAPVNYRLANILQYQEEVQQASACLPALEKRLAAATTIRLDAKERLKKALRVCAKLRPPGSKVLIVNPRFPEEKLRAGALAVPSENKVLVLQSFVESADEDKLVQMLVEEFMHLTSGEGDCSEGFQRALIVKIAELITPKRRAMALEF